MNLYRIKNGIGTYYVGADDIEGAIKALGDVLQREDVGQDENRKPKEVIIFAEGVRNWTNIFQI